MSRFGRLGVLLVGVWLTACQPSDQPAVPAAASPTAPPSPVIAPSPSASPAGSPSPTATPTPAPTPVPTPTPDPRTTTSVQGYVYRYTDPDFPPSPPLPAVQNATVTLYSDEPTKPYSQTVTNASPNYAFAGLPLDTDMVLVAQWQDYSGQKAFHTGTLPDRLQLSVEIRN